MNKKITWNWNEKIAAVSFWFFFLVIIVSVVFELTLNDGDSAAWAIFFLVPIFLVMSILLSFGQKRLFNHLSLRHSNYTWANNTILTIQTWIAIFFFVTNFLLIAINTRIFNFESLKNVIDFYFYK